jgi:tetratricopeptide (TPR) repeat protein
MRKTMISACAGMVAACSMPVVPPAPLAAPAPGAVPQARQLPAALAGEGRYAEAIALLEEGARRRPGPALLGDLGYAYYLGGRVSEARAVLERACLMAPSNPVPWERLAALLETIGETGRALEAMRHARMLREAAAPGQQAPAAPDGKPGADLWPAGMARVEVRQVSVGLVEVERVERNVRVERGERGEPAAPAPTRLEVSNGNGIRGMAAAVARRLRAEGMQVVRLTNTIPFDVAVTRLEVRGSGEPQLRIVLGKDAEIKKPPGISGRQAP